MQSIQDGSSSKRVWWLLLGAVAVFVVVFSLFESLVGKRSRAATPAADVPEVEPSSSAPEVVRLDGGGIEIRFDVMHRTTIRLGDEQAEQALFDCLASGIEQTFGDNTRDWSGVRARLQTRRIQKDCMSRSDVAAPVPPQPSGTETPH